ncbi:hypothetical protein HC891_27145 [Candidatus Gracilibacteria bacterium]|nr:hypothetical protein [Candidatus Gracilibacteria bacterium]
MRHRYGDTTSGPMPDSGRSRHSSTATAQSSRRGGEGGSGSSGTNAVLAMAHQPTVLCRQLLSPVRRG